MYHPTSTGYSVTSNAFLIGRVSKWEPLVCERGALCFCGFQNEEQHYLICTILHIGGVNEHMGKPLPCERWASHFCDFHTELRKYFCDSYCYPNKIFKIFLTNFPWIW